MKNILSLSPRQLSLVCALALVLPACKKFVTLPPPRNEVVSHLVFDDDRTAVSATVGLYSKMMASNNFILNGGMSLYPSLSSDDLFNTAPNSSLDPFLLNEIPPTSNIINNNFWRWGYNYIYHANALIEGLSASSGVHEEAKKQLLGEAKFSRAITFFYLVNLFGDIPLPLSTKLETNESLSRSPVETVYTQILADLKEADLILPFTYLSQGRVRPNRWAVKALLARVHLYRKEWKEAEELSSQVIASGVYSLPPLNNAFLANSNEAIWQLMPVLSSNNSAEGNLFIPSTATARPPYGLTQGLVDAFEVGDGRKSSWIKSVKIGAITYHYPFKYKIRIAPDVTEYNTVLRLGEQYLIRAEARTHLNKLHEAREDINKIRTRAGLVSITTGDKESLLLSIEKERRAEFFAEWGHRWLDLKRTGRINTVLPAVKSSWKTTAALYPIPESEIIANPFLHQNQGY